MDGSHRGTLDIFPAHDLVSGIRQRNHGWLHVFFALLVSAPNYILQHQYAEENAVRKEGKQTLNNTAQQILALALKRTDLDPNDKITGAVWFERGKNLKQLMLRIPIGSQTLEFPLSFNQHK